MNTSFILTIDGPSGAGKGTVSQLIANKYSWNYLDSGAIYRVTAYAMELKNIDVNKLSSNDISNFVRHMKVDFLPDVDSGVKVIFDGQDINALIRTEEHGRIASKYAKNQTIRDALLNWQREVSATPGLVADGRDMGTEVYPNANLKVFLSASAEERAKRRYKQLKEKGIDVNLLRLVDELKERDYQDANRAVSPMVPATDAIMIDSSDLSLAEVVTKIDALIQENLS